MASPRYDIDPHVERMLVEGELVLSYRRRTAIVTALWREFPDVNRATLMSAITRVLRERRKNAQGRLTDNG